MAWDKNCCILGPAGVAGANGLDGAVGPQGPNGNDGALGHKDLLEMMVLLARKDHKVSAVVMVLLGRKVLQVLGHQILA